MKRLLFLFLPMLCAVMSSNASDEARLLRFPAIHGNQIVFTYGGDLYTVSATGGLARKFTSDAAGYEMFARFSPDGKTLAFTGQYDGNTEVYVMPANGGTPRRITYTATLGRDDISDRMGPNNMVMTWKDNQTVIFRSRKQEFNDFKGQLFEATLSASIPNQLPFSTGSWCSYEPDGKRLAFNKVMREFRTWKYYKGGMADDVWIYDPADNSIVNITNNDAQDIFPMWYGQKVYFLSDRDRIMNLFAYDLTTKTTTKVTNFTDYDIKFPSLGDEAIVFEKGGYIWTYNLKNGQLSQIRIELADDGDVRPIVTKDASKNITSWDVSPDGKRALFGARGDVFTVPVKNGITRNLTQSSGANDRNIGWSPDGKTIAFISDRTGEDEIYIIPEAGGEAIKITSGSDTWKYDILWSPDSKKIAWGDKMNRLQFVDVDTKKVTLVAQTPDGELRDFAWSPDSRWIAYTFPIFNSSSVIRAYNLQTAESKDVTSSWYDAGSPSFSPDGKYLYFSSSRDFNPSYSWTEWNHIYTDMNKVYMVPLAKATTSPFAYENDEVVVKNENSEKKTDKQADKDKAKKVDEPEGVKVEIDFDGIEERALAISSKPAAYWGVLAVGDGVYYTRFATGEEQPAMVYWNIKSKKETEIGNFNSYILASGGDKMMVNSRGKYGIIDLPKGKTNLDEFIDMGGMMVNVDLKQEWLQIFNECWRQMRDFFYDKNMHGVDWKAIGEKYRPLVSHVVNRNDLNYIMGEMIGELTTGHSYINGGERIMPNRVKTGLLGASFSRDKSGYFKVEKILAGENWNPTLRSPLTEVGVDVKEGDFILAIDEQPVTTVNDLHQMLIGKAGRIVQLTVNSSASTTGSRKVLVKPIADENPLYYYNWVQNNIRKVSEATNGEVGYIHIPDMGPEGLNEFVKYYYPQLNKRALIIDDRGNGGGNVSPMIIERLRRELVLLSIARNGAPNTKPAGMLWGPKVLLLDRYSASDGDLFPYQFKTMKMGKTIGVRSWGGVVGIRGPIPFIDGGYLNRPEFAHYAADGSKFVIEGHGVDPDIVIDNDPYKEFMGQDDQLNRAIKEITEDLRNWPKQIPQAPAYPNKSK